MPSTNQESTATAGEDSRPYQYSSGRFTGDDTLAPRPQPPERSFDPVVRGAQHLERKRDLPADSTAPEANRPAKIPACCRNRLLCEMLMRQLLRTKLYNSSNACCINAALLEQLWATLAYEGFDPELWGQWRAPLLELLDTPEGVDLCVSTPFQRLLQPWFNDHAPTDQQDATEFLGWLRGQHLLGHVWGQESNGWQTRLAHSTEDRGALLAPLLLRMPDEKRCDLQVLINMWHC